MTSNAAPAATVRTPGSDLRDGDLVYVTGRWQVLNNVRPEGVGHFRAQTDRGSELLGNAVSLYAVAVR